MNTERESQFSAYLDDQLPPDERRSVEMAVESDPAAAEALRSLAGVRDLIAGLSRPTGPDLVPEVMERLKGRNLEHWGRRPMARRLRLAAWATGGVAASIACLALFGERLQPAPRPAPPSARPIESILAQSEPTADSSVEPDAVELMGPPAPPRTELSIDEPAPAIASTDQPSAEAPASDPERSLVHELLDGRRSPRIFLVTDLDGDATTERVATLLGLSTHRDFHRIDPPPADAEGDAEKVASTDAVAFAATLDPAELATFRERLATAFPERFEEGDEKPAVAAQLADRGRITTLSANPAADVLIPQTKLAIRFQPQERRIGPAAPRVDDGIAKGESTKPSPEAAPVGDEASRQATAESPATDPDRPRSVLVWIIKAPKD